MNQNPNGTFALNLKGLNNTRRYPLEEFRRVHLGACTVGSCVCTAPRGENTRRVPADRAYLPENPWVIGVENDVGVAGDPAGGSADSMFAVALQPSRRTASRSTAISRSPTRSSRTRASR